MVYYAIKLAPKSFVRYCKNGILETTDTPMYCFEKAECDKIADVLKERYFYTYSLYGSVNSIEEVNLLKKDTSNKPIIIGNDDCFTL